MYMQELKEKYDIREGMNVYCYTLMENGQIVSRLLSVFRTSDRYISLDDEDGFLELVYPNNFDNIHNNVIYTFTERSKEELELMFLDYLRSEIKANDIRIDEESKKLKKLNKDLNKLIDKIKKRG